MKKIIAACVVALGLVLSGTATSTASAPKTLSCPNGWVAYDSARGGGEWAYCETGKRPAKTDVVRLQKKVKHLKQRVRHLKHRINQG